MMVVNSGEEALAYKAPSLVIIPPNENICFKQSNCFNFPFCPLKESSEEETATEASLFEIYSTAKSETM